MKKSKVTKTLELIALVHGVSTAEVRKEIRLALDTGWESPDPAVQAYWAKIPRKGKKPTLEEVILYMADRVSPKGGKLRPPLMLSSDCAKTIRLLAICTNPCRGDRLGRPFIAPESPENGMVSLQAGHRGGYPLQDQPKILCILLFHFCFCAV